MTFNQHHARCLAKTVGNKPNGCALADTCQRHVAIRQQPPGDQQPVIERVCSELETDYYIPLEAA